MSGFFIALCPADQLRVVLVGAIYLYPVVFWKVFVSHLFKSSESR